MAPRTVSLVSSFDIDARTHVVALVGAGGKTSCMFRLAAEMVAEGRRVVTTTTTKIFRPTRQQSPALLIIEEDPRLDTLPRLLAVTGHVTVGTRVLPTGKLDGVSESDLDAIRAQSDIILVEADGAAGHAVKAPESWEPVIPSSADLVIPVAGLDCVGKPADDETVFRVQRFLDVTGISDGDPITPHVLARLFSSPAGALRGVPSPARVVPLLSKLDKLDSRYAIAEIAALILARIGSRSTRIVAARLHEPIEAQIYEAGPVV